mgnify:CR=1 FL=1
MGGHPEHCRVVLTNVGFVVPDKPSRFFNVGRVFKTLWVEPAGNRPQNNHLAYNPVGYGQFSYAKLRYFVVIRKRLHSCLCLAIHTYSGQGSAKGSVRSQDHAIVYSALDTEPQPLPHESITIGSFAIVLEEPGETIAPTSRLDFGKIYTVEHNLKILRVGRILPSHLPNLEQAFVDSLLGPAVARQELLPVSSPTQQRNCPSSIDWYNYLFEERHSSRGAENQIVYDREFYRSGRVFQVLTHREDQNRILRFIFIVLEQGVIDCKCLLVKQDATASPARSSPIIFDGCFDNTNHPNDAVHVQVNDPTFLETAVASCVKYEKVYAVSYGVFARYIGDVVFWSLPCLLYGFQLAHQVRLQGSGQSGAMLLSPSRTASADDDSGREFYASPPDPSIVVPFQHARRETLARGSSSTIYPPVSPPQSTISPGYLRADIDHQMQVRPSQVSQFQQGVNYSDIQFREDLARVPSPSQNLNTQHASDSSRPPPEAQGSFDAPDTYVSQHAAVTGYNVNERITRWTEEPLPVPAFFFSPYLDGKINKAYSRPFSYNSQTSPQVPQPGNSLPDSTEQRVNELTERFGRLRSPHGRP